jgi:hypothetical protein
VKSCTAIIRSVTQTEAGDARINLTTLDDACPLYLDVLCPPPMFDAVVGTELQITRDAVYVAGKLWGKRSVKARRYLHLVARKGE